MVAFCTSYLLLHNKLPQTEQLKRTHIYDLIVSVGHESRYCLAGSSGSGSLMRLQSRYQPGPQASPGKDQLPRSLRCPLARFDSTEGVGCRALVPQVAVAFPRGSSQHSICLPAEQAHESKRGIRSLFVTECKN